MLEKTELDESFMPDQSNWGPQREEIQRQKLKTVQTNFVISFLSMGVEQEYMHQVENALVSFDSGLRLAKNELGVSHALSNQLTGHYREIKKKVETKRKKEKSFVEKLLNDTQKNFLTLNRIKKNQKISLNSIPPQSKRPFEMHLADFGATAKTEQRSFMQTGSSNKESNGFVRTLRLGGLKNSRNSSSLDKKEGRNLQPLNERSTGGSFKSNRNPRKAFSAERKAAAITQERLFLKNTITIEEEEEMFDKDLIGSEDEEQEQEKFDKGLEMEDQNEKEAATSMKTTKEIRFKDDQEGNEKERNDEMEIRRSLGNQKGKGENEMKEPSAFQETRGLEESEDERKEKENEREEREKREKKEENEEREKIERKERISFRITSSKRGKKKLEKSQETKEKNSEDEKETNGERNHEESFEKGRKEGENGRARNEEMNEETVIPNGGKEERIGKKNQEDHEQNSANEDFKEESETIVEEKENPEEQNQDTKISKISAAKPQKKSKPGYTTAYSTGFVAEDSSEEEETSTPLKRSSDSAKNKEEMEADDSDSFRFAETQCKLLMNEEEMTKRSSKNSVFVETKQSSKVDWRKGRESERRCQETGDQEEESEDLDFNEVKPGEEFDEDIDEVDLDDD